MSAKIDVRRILKAHFKTLVDASDPDEKTGFSDWVSFLLLPIFIAVILVVLEAYMSDSILGTLVSAFSIFVGLLLNVVVLLFDIVRTTADEVKKKVVKETLSNVTFAIILSLLTIPFALSTQITRWPWLKPYTSFITYFFACVFVATLLMIIKRVYNLFFNEAAAATKELQAAEEEDDGWKPFNEK